MPGRLTGAPLPWVPHEGVALVGPFSSLRSVLPPPFLLSSFYLLPPNSIHSLSSTSSTLGPKDLRSRNPALSSDAAAGAVMGAEGTWPSFVVAGVSAPPWADFVFFFFFSCEWILAYQFSFFFRRIPTAKRKTHLLPAPHGPETVEEAYVLEEVRIQPQARRHGEHRHAEQDQAHDGHGEEQADQAQHAHAQVPHPDAQLHRPQREHDHRHDQRQRTARVQFRAPLRALPQPDVVQVRRDVLLLLDAHGPEAFDAVLGLFGRGKRGVVVAVVGVAFGDAEGEEGEGEEFEDFGGGHGGGEGGEEGVFRGGGGGVGGGGDGAEGTFDW